MQKVLLLHGPKQRYTLTDWPLPTIDDPYDVLIRIEAIGLNPMCANLGTCHQEAYPLSSAAIGKVQSQLSCETRASFV
jgi:hypothetical protein